METAVTELKPDEGNGFLSPSRQISHKQAFFRVTRHLLLRVLGISVTIFLGIFITAVVVNKYQALDDAVVAQIDLEVYSQLLERRMSGYYSSPGSYQQAVSELRFELSLERGLYLPFFSRHLRWTSKALRLDFGESTEFSTLADPVSAYLSNPDAYISGDDTSSRISAVILSRLPNTLLLVGVAYLITFLVGIPLALLLFRKAERWIDRLVSLLSPISSIPSWVLGIILVLLFALQLNLLPARGMYDTVNGMVNRSFWVVVRHALLPVSAILLSILFQMVYAWRTYFLLYANEDYVELARAKGLVDRMVERRYVLRPTLPYILTSFALLMVGFWQSTAALEYVFGWPGIGKLYIESLPFQYITPDGTIAIDPGDLIVTIGLVVVFAYLMGVTVFLLDILYAIVDPRVRLGRGGETLRGGVVGSRGGFTLLQEQKMVPGGPGSPKGSRIIQTDITLSWKFVFRHIDWPTIKVLGARWVRGFLQGFRDVPVTVSKIRMGFSSWWRTISGTFRSVKSAAREIIRIPAAVFGLFVILILVGGSIAAVIIYPYSELGRLWYVPETTDRVTVPDYAAPIWVNWFRKDKLPPMIFADSRDGKVSKVVQPGTSGNVEDITITFTINYPYGGFPRDLLLYIDSQYEQKKPFAYVTLVTPDGKEFLLGRFAVTPETSYSLEDDITKQDLTQIQADRGISSDDSEGTVASLLFADLSSERLVAMKGTYQLRIDGLFFEEGNDMDAELVLIGQVYGAAGTDYARRDLLIPLLWGMPFALAYGLLGALVTTILSMVLAAMGVWFGGWVDRLIQWLIEVTMILPVVAIAVIVYIFIEVDIWILLTVVVLLNVFGTPTKSFRAAFLQVKNLPYMEAAQSYGASSGRIILHYMVPRIVTVLIPQLVSLIPSFVFLEATLGLFGIYSKYPTWGRVIYDALQSGISWGSRFWVLEPISLLLLTGLGFAMLGFALERVLNPRLKDV